MEYLLKSTALIVLMYAAYSMLLKRETFFTHNRWFLLTGLLGAFFLPLIYIPKYIKIEKVPMVSNLIVPHEIPNQISQQNDAIDWLELFMIIYFIGVIIFFIQFLFQFGSLTFLLLKNAKNKDGIYTYVLVKKKISPFSFFKWIVYNPTLFNNEELQLILNHERVHVRQWHSVDIIVSRLACVLLWFNPLVWLYHKDIQQNLEYIADEAAQNSSFSIKNYQQLLLKTSVGNTTVNLTSNFYNSLIKKRIVMLQKSKSKSVKRWKSALILPFILLFLMSVNRKEIFEYYQPEDTSRVQKQQVTPNYVFHSKSTDDGIKELTNELSKYDIILEVKNLERNSKNIITTIHFKFSDKITNENIEYKDSNPEGINAFMFKKNSDNKLNIEKVNYFDSEEIIEVVEQPEVIEEHEVIKKKEVIVEELEESTTKKPKSKLRKNKTNENVFVYSYSNDDNNQENIWVVKSSEDDEPIYIVNGKRVEKEEIIDIEAERIKKINVIKSKAATDKYGKDGEDGVIEIITKGTNTWVVSDPEVTKIEKIIAVDDFSDSNNVFISVSNDELNAFLLNHKNATVVVNGKIISNPFAKDFDYTSVKSAFIVKKEKAKEIYGDTGKNGIVVISTDNEKYDFKSSQDSNYKVQVNALRFDDDNNDTTMVLHYITKDTPDNVMETHKKQLAKTDITVKYSKLKRNKNGEIVKIKVSLNDSNGNKASATFENSNGIPKIAIGKKGNSLIASSSF